MSLIEAEGIILKSYNLADADKIVVFFTRKQGLVRGVAKGAKRLKSKFGGGLELFSIVHITYRQKEEIELVYIQQIELTQSFFDNASEPKFLQKFGYLLDLLVEFSPPHEPNENLYKMTHACLNSASKTPDELESISFYFEFWTLKLCGYFPNWKSCGKCNRAVGQEESVSLQFDFRIFCDDCGKGKRSWAISSSERSLFSNAKRLSPDKFVSEVAEQKQNLIEMSKILKLIISRVLDREIVEGTSFAIN